jgi:cytochrome c-type biogenesis protein CcmH
MSPTLILLLAWVLVLASLPWWWPARWLPGAARVRGRAGLALLWLGVLLAAVGLYRMLGAAEDIRIRQQMETVFEGGDHDPEALAALMDRIEQRVNAGREQPAYLLLLADAAMRAGRPAEAAGWYRRLNDTGTPSARWLALEAQARFMANDNRFTPAITGLLDRALALEPRQPTARGLLGMAAFAEARYADAVTHWEKALAGLPPDSQAARSLRSGLAEARKRGGGDTPAADGPAIRVSLRLGDGITAPPDTPVFVFVRGEAPRPLAARRLRVSDLPATVMLDERHAVMGDAGLAEAGRVRVAARVSLGGTPRPGSGDIEGESDWLVLDAALTEVALTLDRVRP